MKIDIGVTEGGERLYVYPVSYWMDSYKNKILYLKPDSLPVYKHYLLYDFWSNTFLIKEFGFISRIWYCFVKKFFVSLIDYLSQSHRLWRTYVPIIGCEIFEPRLGLKRQLQIFDSECLSETYYLVPSDKYVEQALIEKYLGNPKDDN